MIKKTNKMLSCFVLLIFLVSTIGFASAVEQDTTKDVPIGRLYVTAYLNQKFQLKQGETAVVKDYNAMVVKYISYKPCVTTIVGCKPVNLKVELPSSDTTVASEFSLGIGESKEVAGAKISLLALDSGVATLIVTKGIGDINDNKINVYLDQKFQLKQGQIATVVDYKNMMVEYVSPDAVSAPCLKGEECPITKQSIILKVKIVSIILEQSTNPSANVFPAPSTEVKFGIAVGESKEVAGVKITLINLENGIATLIVTKGTERTGDISVYLDQKFQLKEMQTAVVQDYESMTIYNRGGILCTTGMGRLCKSGIGLGVSWKGQEIASWYELSVGESKEILGAKISLLALENGVATLIVTKGEETEQKSIPVLLDQKFQLKQGEQAGVVDYENLKVIYLSAASSAPCPKEGSCPITNEFIMLRVEKPYTTLLSSGSVTVSTATTKIENPLEVPVSESMTTKEFIIGVGETKKAFGAKISLLSLDNGVASLIVSKSPITRVKRPSCEKIGTKMEGWYVGNELIRYDNCACVAVCKGAGTGSAGFYSSCTGELIKQAECSETETEVIETSVQTIGGTEEVVQTGIIQIMSREITTTEGQTLQTNVIQIKPETATESKAKSMQTGVVQIMSKETAITKERIMVDEGKLMIETNSGAKEIKYMPEEAKKKAIDSGEITEVSKIEIIKENENPTYNIVGKKKSYILWIFPYTTEKTIKVDAQTNQVVG